jgi:gluconokinase
VLAIDIGSSSLRTAFFTETGIRLIETTAARKYSVRYGNDGAAELDPRELLRAARSCLRATTRGRKNRISAVAGSAIWHSLLGVDRRGEPLTPVYTWADSRSAADARALRAKLRERDVQLRTGCMLRAPYWPAKLRWLRRTNGTLFRRVARWTSPGAWLFAQLFDANATSHSMASGTGLYNLERAAWDTELCGLCDVRVDQLDVINDRCLTSSGVVFPALGDGAASNLGSGADRPGHFAINIGTSAAVRTIESRGATRGIPAGLFRYVVDEERLLLGGAISNAGNLRQWCLRELRITDAEGALERAAVAADPLTVLPLWVAERAPTWPQNLGGMISGLTNETKSSEILRAVTTSTFYRLADILDRLTLARSAEVIVSGGILHSPNSVAILADCLGHDLRICRELESSLRGAAIHALEQLGYSPKPLRRGRLVRQRPALAAKHRLRRARQNALERELTRADLRSRSAARPAA